MCKFEKEVEKGLEAKTPKTTAKQIKRYAEAAIKGQIAALEGSILKKEIAVEKAKEAKDKAFYARSIEQAEDSDAYIKGIFEARKAVKKAESDLADAIEWKAELEASLSEFK